MMMDLAAFQEMLASALRPVAAEIVSPWFYVQVGLLLVAAGIAAVVGSTVRSRSNDSTGAAWPSSLRRLLRGLTLSTGVVAFALTTFAMRAAMIALAPPHHTYLLITAARLAIAWLVIRLVASLIRNDTIVWLVSISTWVVAALSIVGWLDPVVDALDSVAVVIGGIRLTPLLVIKASVFLAVALWLSGFASRLIESQIESTNDLTPSLQVLLSKIVRLALIVVAVMTVMAAVGIDISSLAIFTGAVGVGLGLGLQKIVSNFISGIILLTDKSVKPGDLITIGDFFGRVSSMKTRYISVAAGDGREFLIPNEDLVTQKVVNWTYSDRNTLVKIAFATSYDVDPRAVCKLAADVAAATPRVMAARPPSCLLGEFGDNGMKFVLTFWVADLGEGTDNVKSEVLAALWDKFRSEGIRIPVPARDVRLTDARTASVAAEPPRGGAGEA
ncbi:MAG: mechanosensitive ion channel [Xanthobacteraceae bacterium]|nr:mechanosensitive ion channel [Xanthobacteraceae bacterium]